jgi:hypothetical protein
VDTPRFAEPDVLRTLRLTGRQALSTSRESRQTPRIELKDVIENEDSLGIEAFGAEAGEGEEEGEDEDEYWVADGAGEEESIPLWKRPPSGWQKPHSPPLSYNSFLIAFLTMMNLFVMTDRFDAGFVQTRQV